MDRISGLPDELLHDILLRLDSARTVARTSALSRRWRHVWAALPDLDFDRDDGDDAPQPPALFLVCVDGAVRAYSLLRPGHQATRYLPASQLPRHPGPPRRLAAPGADASSRCALVTHALYLSKAGARAPHL
jgi:hypothetical protein